MSHDSPDRFTQGILDRLDGVEDNPRIDRDGRRGLVALGVILLVLVTMVAWQAVPGRAGRATGGDLEAGLPLLSPGSILEAVDRIQVPAASGGAVTEDHFESRETEADPRRYEVIDATAPGCRT